MLDKCRYHREGKSGHICSKNGNDCPGFGLPHIETKRVILENNIKMFGKVPPDVIVCQYDGEQITFPDVKVYYQKVSLGNF